MVIVAELANTALETAVDLAYPDFHPLARAAKDVAAGAVLVAAFAAAAVGWVALYPKLDPKAARLLEQVNDSEPMVIAATLLSVLVVVVLLKALVGRGRPLFGGMPSGHAAASFAIATVVTLRTEDPTVGVLTGTLALMVSHSRLLHRIHTRGEVLAGAVIGTLIASMLFWLIR
jgi:diacylglycerol kinase (ATP)